MSDTVLVTGGSGFIGSHVCLMWLSAGLGELESASSPAMRWKLTRRLTANLKRLETSAAAVWINTWSGERLEAGAVVPGIRSFEKPKSFGEAPAVLIVGRVP